MDQAKKIKVALMLAGLVLCLGVIPMWPSWYYGLLRWVVCAVCGYTAYWFSKIPLLVKYSFCLGFLAFLFNPILIVPFDTSLWILVYLGTAICLLTLAKKIS